MLSCSPEKGERRRRKMDNLTHYLATTLKTLRHQREWSLSRLAEETGVSKAMLGQIERNES
ncbi:MAG: helix-turn-helix transcriptional regulator, partial [Hafnia alvei]|nr:helix-turn-helix transcriptional regulator [Hafnia alvei]